jgi:hypothetical protein
MRAAGTPYKGNTEVSSGFVKVYGAILDSSVWAEPLSTRVVWITMLAMADRHGHVAASSDGISRRANVPLKATDHALEILAAPDLRSRSGDFEGRRVERVDGGYRILNYKKYRDLQSPAQKAAADRQKKWRDDKALRNATSQLGDGNKRPKAKAKAKAKADNYNNNTSGEVDVGKPWPVQAAEFWGARVAPIPEGRIGAQLKPTVDAHGWAKARVGMEAYVFATPDGRWNLQHYANTANYWIDLGLATPRLASGDFSMTNPEGDWTPLGKLVNANTRRSA